MTIAETNRFELGFAAESTWGETPSSPTLQLLPLTGETLAHTKETRNSATIRSDANRQNVLEVGVGALGDINFELIQGGWDTFLAYALRSSFSAQTVTATDISFSASNQRVLDASSGLAGFVVGQWVLISGAYNEENNGFFRVTGVNAGYLTLANGAASIVDELAGNSVTIKGNVLRNGIVNSSFVCEKKFKDISKYIYYPGCIIGGMSLNVQALEIITGTFNVQGKQGVPQDTSIQGAETAASSNEAMTASANVGTILVDGVTLTTPIRSITLDVTNNVRTRPQVGSKYTSNFGRGEFSVSGSFETYFEDHTQYNKLIGHTAVSLSWRATDIDGNALIFTIPNIYSIEGSPNAPSGNEDCVLPLNFEASYTTVGTANFTLQIDSLAA